MPMGMSLHVAFDVELDDVLGAPMRLRESGVEPLPFFGQAADEPSVIGWMPAAAVYFRDPDGHSSSTSRCSTRSRAPRPAS